MLAGEAFVSKRTVAMEDASIAPIIPQGKSATVFVDKLIARVNSLGGYKFDGFQEARRGDKILKATGTFYFKPRNAMRVEVKDYGSKGGSVLVKNQDGKIIGKGGPQMFGMRMTLTPDSRLLQMPNGTSAVESDLLTLLNKLKRGETTGCKLISADTPIQVDGLGKPVIILESQVSGTSGTAVVDRVYLDPSQQLPLQWDVFADGKFQSRSKFQNYQTNMRLDDAQFNL